MVHRKSRTAYIQRGHFWIIVTFLLLRAVEAFAYHSCYKAHEKTLLAVIINANIVSIALLAAIWFRQLWARIALIILIILLLVLGISFVAFLEEFFGDKFPAVMAVSCSGYIAAAVILIAPPSLHKLTSRVFE